jgi:predicted GTPase
LTLESRGELLQTWPSISSDTLNELQKSAHDIIVKSVQEGLNLCMLLLGGGGCGKSHTLNAVRTTLQRLGRSMLVLGTTGKAASMVHGATVHSSTQGLWIPIQGFKELSGTIISMMTMRSEHS